MEKARYSMQLTWAKRAGQIYIQERKHVPQQRAGLAMRTQLGLSLVCKPAGWRSVDAASG
jgi:hypothetical protein